MRTATSTLPQRDRLIRLIHVAKRELMLEDDIYRATLIAVTGRSSSSELSVPELNAVLDHLKSKGFKVRPRKQSRALASSPDAKKIRALWLFLHEIGAIKNPSEEALGAYVKRIAQVDALQWLDGKQSMRVIESMKKWAMRFLPGKIEELVSRWECASPAEGDVIVRKALAAASEYRSFGKSQWAYYRLKEALGMA